MSVDTTSSKLWYVVCVCVCIPCSDIDNVSHFVSSSLELCFLKILPIALIRQNVTLGWGKRSERRRRRLEEDVREGEHERRRRM